jgi:hypothetical protein
MGHREGCKLTNDLKWLICSDIHIPIHSERMLTMLFDVIKWWKPDAIDIAGDQDDACGTSRWADGSVDEVNNKVLEDSMILKQFSGDMRLAAPQADLHWHDGNHGWTRHDSYIKTKAKALDGLITPDMIYDLDKNGWEWHSYQGPPVKRFGDMHVHHGLAISKHGGQSVKQDMEDWNVSLIRGHSHRQASYRKSVVFSDEEMTTTQNLEGYEIGHLMNVSKASYSQTHNWQPGFAIAHVENGERPHVQLVPIHMGSEGWTCWVDGKKFTS